MNTSGNKVVKLIAFLFVILALLYLYSAIIFTGIIYTLDKAMGGENLVFSVLKYFPGLGLIAILLVLVAIWFYFVALRISLGSKSSFWLGVISLITIPASVAVTSQFLISPFVQSLSDSSLSTDMGIPKSFGIQNIRWNDPIFIIFLITSIVLIFQKGKFNLANNIVTRKSKLVFIVLSLWVLIPICTISGRGYIRALDTDYGYTSAKAKVDYHVYKPVSLPLGLTYATKFSINKQIANKNNGIQVIFDLSFPEIIKGNGKIVVLKQTGVEPNFDFQSYSQTIVDEPTSIEPTTLNGVDYKWAMIIKKEFEKTTVNYLTYITSDDVLIWLASPHASLDELKQLAQSLQ